MKGIVIRLLEYDFIPVMWNIHTRTKAEKHLVCSSVANSYSTVTHVGLRSKVKYLTSLIILARGVMRHQNIPSSWSSCWRTFRKYVNAGWDQNSFAVASKHSTHVVRRMAPSTVATVALKWRKRIFQTFIWSDYFILSKPLI